MIDIDLIERVEIVRGPSSTIYGTNAFFGVINIITRTPEDVGGAEIEANAAEYDTYQGRASFGQKFENGSELLISGTKFSSDGQQNLYFPEFDSSETNNGMAQNLDGEDGISLFGHMKWDEISVETGFVDRNKDVPTAAFDTEFNDPQFKTSDSRFFANVSYDGELSEKTRLVARVYYDWYEYNGNYPYDYAEEDDSEPFFVTNRDEARAERYGVQAHIVTSVIEGHKIIVGTEGRYDFNVDQENFDIDPEYQYLDTHNDDSLAAIYLQDDITLLDWLHLNVGTRYDHYDRAGLAWSPRAGLVARTAEDSAIKLLYGRAFRAPNLFELYYLDAETQKAPGSLSPETIDTYELIYEQHIDQKTRYTLSSYYYTIEDLISQTIDAQDDLLVYQNLDKVNAFGFEGEFEKRWHDGWSIKSSYSYQRAEDDFNNRQLSNSPQHMWKTHFVTPLIKEKLFSGFELIYLDARKTLSRASTDSYWLANLTLSTDNIFPGLDLSTSIYNLFDVDYGDPASTEHRQDQIPALGRTWRVQLTYRFSNPI